MLKFHLGLKLMSPKAFPAVKNPSFPRVGGLWTELRGVLWMGGGAVLLVLHNAATLRAPNQAINNHCVVRSTSARHTIMSNQ